MEERSVAQLGQRLEHAAAGAEKLAPFIGNDDLRLPPLREMALDLIGQMMHVDYRTLDLLRGEAVQDVIDECLATDLNERFGHLPVEGPHARPQPGRQHHGAFQRGRHSARFRHEWVLPARP